MVDWDDEPLMWDDPHGLVYIGGDLEPETLLAAYQRGIFPWFNEGDPVVWWSPDPRAVFELDSFHVPRRLARTIRQCRFTVTFNQCFETVMRSCGVNREEGTWITESMVQGFVALHDLGHAHSLEVWKGHELAGGIYGVTVGAMFAAESMFYRQTDASKVALFHLVERLKAQGYQLLDTQILTPHTRSLGAVEIPRSEYLRRLRAAVERTEVRFKD